MAIVHLVLIQLKGHLSSSQILDLCNAFVAMKDTALNAAGKQYIQNITGGKNNSPEPFSQGLTHAFSVIFASAEDRDYYVDHDPVHGEFKKLIGPNVEKITVVDYEPESF